MNYDERLDESNGITIRVNTSGIFYWIVELANVTCQTVFFFILITACWVWIRILTPTRSVWPKRWWPRNILIYLASSSGQQSVITRISIIVSNSRWYTTDCSIDFSFIFSRSNSCSQWTSAGMGRQFERPHWDTRWWGAKVFSERCFVTASIELKLYRSTLRLIP